MKTKTRLLLLIPILSCILASCSDEESSSNLDASKASEDLTGVASEMSNDIVSLTQSEGVNGASALVDLLENSTVLGRVAYDKNENVTYATQQTSLVGQYFTFGVARLLQEDEELWDYKGVYVWNFNLEEFELIEESDILVVAFPLEGSDVNNAEFHLTEIAFVEVDGEEFPTVIKAALAIEEPGQAPVDVIVLDFSAEFGEDDSLDKADVSLDVLPFSFQLEFDDTQSTTSSLFAQLLLNGENITGIDVTITFDSEAKLEPVAVSGDVSYRSLRIVGSVSDDELNASEDGDPNDYIDLDLFINENKAGDIIFVLEEEEDEFGVYEEYIAYVQYADGTTENLEDILQPVFDEIDILVDDLE